ncbi:MULTISPECIES: sensor histidine kinase [Streptomyces]|uniref:sensor histidine kinase n=2 Tax=Streptomyces TaxID=1883 RepID=UPI0006FD872C|nr:MULTISPECIES: nitrate- and nitrite sensing domain-containing protein [unclassified Streptomyces]KQZ06889.1 histidine kinase [Streptomyces sp. Root55]MDX3061965.1 nitrate- and nitrite sensing domain-containing protein [Streptomyces sp. ND04-05B]
MQKKRPRSKDSTREESGAMPPAAGAGKRTVRVRSRLVAGVAVVGITVVAAGAPAALGASSDLNESQRLVTLAELNQQAITLAHSLADERDRVTAHIAAGRDDDDKGGKDGEGDPAARVDQQVDEIREAAPAALRRDLSTIPALRRTALTGKGTAMEAHQAYSEVIAKLHDLADELAEKTPPRAAEATRAPLALGGAVEQASATRGLLLAALAVPGTQQAEPQIDPFTGLPVQNQDEGGSEDDRNRDELSAAAQQTRVQELASLAEFDQAAAPAARDKLASTVTGPEINSAEKYLTRLTDRPELSDTDRAVDAGKVSAALSARIDRMRSVESALGTAQVKRLEQLRDDDVTALELRLALLGGCLLIAVGVSTAVARTLTQPLAVLRIGAGRIAAEPETAEPVRYTGRNDEFAQVVRSINAVHGKLHALQQDVTGRSEGLRTERSGLVADRETLTLQRDELQVQVVELTKQLRKLRNTVNHTFVNLSLRNLGLVERQLGVIEGMEEREQDPERLATLFKLDHMATVMRRHSENMLVLAGTEHGQGHPDPIPLVDVLRAAVSEIERYERVTIQSLPPHARIAGFAADDLSHLVAELLENATSFSPPDSHVELSGWVLETGEVMLSVQDEGIGMSAVRMGELNARLADPASFEAGEQAADGAGLGLQVTSLLAARHGIRVELREQKGSGVAAVVVLPGALLPKAPPTASPPPVQLPGDAPTLNLPGSVAEANSNALPARSADGTDPLIEAAERTLRESGTDPAPSPEAVPAVPAVEDPAAQELTAPALEGPAAEEPTVPAPEGPAAGELTPPAPEGPAAEEPAEPVVEGPVQESAAEEATHAAAAPVTEPSRTPSPDTAAPGTTAVPAESEAETTMQVRLPRPQDAPGPYAIGPDRHERAADTSPAAPGPSSVADALPGPRQPLTGTPSQGLGEEVPDPAPVPERLTDKGLPKRTPGIASPAAAPAAERTGGLDKDDLRRRLGGFHQGAEDGRRDVEAEIAEGAPETDNTELTDRTEGRIDETGDTVEEARS